VRGKPVCLGLPGWQEPLQPIGKIIDKRDPRAIIGVGSILRRLCAFLFLQLHILGLIMGVIALDLKLTKGY